ncbi:MAG TPA: glycosyltransferase family 4 protein [Bacteroidia bacterium]|nr:glycosyltransferase family 4 protein [Bacteroidia bacterium]HMU18360.1 glycosyltransferase family 4 protein [Bacteroidia bacterium]
MKKVLIITYYWPPSGGAGVQRWLKFSKYLREFGWEPVVFTVANGEFPEQDNSFLKDIPKNLEVIKVPIKEPYVIYKLLTGRKKNEKIHAGFLTEKKKKSFLQDFAVWVRGNFFIPDARMLWIKPSVKALQQWLNTNTVDAIASTGPPHTCHLIAMQLKDKTGLPWLADFRDPWTNIDFYKDLKLTRWADKKHHRLEKTVITTADAVVTIGKTMQEEFATQFNRKIECITNGYDDADTSIMPDTLDMKFSLAHIGTMVRTRNPQGLWQALYELLDEIPDLKNHLEIKLAGKVDAAVGESLNHYSLTNYVNRIEYLNHDEVLKVQQQSQVLLLVVNNTPNAKGVVTGKLFEYLAAKRPILCIGPTDGDAAKIIVETQSGHCTAYDDVARIKTILKDYFNKFLKSELISNAKNIEAYCRKNLTEKLSEVLNNITQNK